MYLHECVEAERYGFRMTDQRWDVGVGVVGGKRGSMQHDTSCEEDYRDERSGEVWPRRSLGPAGTGNIPCTKGLGQYPYPRALPFGSGKGDHGPPFRYPLSLGTPNIRECEPG
jgi:hypothetical protein